MSATFLSQYDQILSKVLSELVRQSRWARVRIARSRTGFECSLEALATAASAREPGRARNCVARLAGDGPAEPGTTPAPPQCCTTDPRVGSSIGGGANRHDSDADSIVDARDGASFLYASCSTRRGHGHDQGVSGVEAASALAYAGHRRRRRIAG